MGASAIPAAGGWQQALLVRWYGATPVWWLIPLSLLFQGVVTVRRALYRWRWLASERLPVPVIVVGNLVVGGAGKTPAVMAVVAALQAAGWRPGVLSRGYLGSAAAPRLVAAGDNPAECGDEAVLLANTLGVPLAIGRRRSAAGLLLLRHHPELDCLVCDDGLQHLALQRTVELVVIDRARGLGNRWCLPAGPLREPVRRLASVDALLLHGAAGADAAAAADADAAARAGVGAAAAATPGVGADAVDRLAADLPAHVAQAELVLVMQAPQRLADGMRRDWPEWAGQTVHAVAGIGDPARFFAGLRARGLTVLPHPFPDHHAFRPADLRFEDPYPILLTAKDAVKCTGFAPARCWCVPLQATLPGGLPAPLMTLLERSDGRQTA